MKRFQDCNRVGKLIRYRWYLLIPIKYCYYNFFKKFKVFQDEIIDDSLIHTDNYEILKGNRLWEILKGDAQNHMNWYYTMDEVKNKINKIKSGDC